MDDKRKRREESDVEATSSKPSQIELDDSLAKPKKRKKVEAIPDPPEKESKDSDAFVNPNKQKKQKKVETTPDSSEKELDDREALLKSKKRKKQKVETTPDPPEIESEDSVALVNPKRQKVAKWSSSSSESEYEALYNPMQLCARNWPEDVTEAEVKEFFKGTPDRVIIAPELDKDDEIVNTGSLIIFSSASETTEALKLKGNSLRGNTIYVARQGNNRALVCVSGFNNHLAEDHIRKQLSKKFQSRGEVLHVFLPTNSKTGSCLGFGYIYLENASENLYDSTKVGGVQVVIRDAKPKKCFEAAMVGREILLKEGSDEDKKIALKKMFLPIKRKLDLSMKTEMILSWREKRPDITAEPYEQVKHDCWAVALSRTYSAALKLSGSSRPHLTPEDLYAGVDAAHQVLGEGINNIKHAIPFMEAHGVKMCIHHRPRGDKVSDFEEFENFIIQLLPNGPLMVTVEVLPSYEAWDGKGIYRPTEIDCYLRTIEKFAVHCLVLSAHGIKDGKEIWDLEDSQGIEWGNGGCIQMERHLCLIKSVIELKLNP